MKKPIFIAEIKTESPYGFKSTKSFFELMQIAIKHGDWISVHTNPLWGGSMEAIEFVRRHTNKPILAKGIHSTKDQFLRARNMGATFITSVDSHFFGYVGEQYITDSVNLVETGLKSLKQKAECMNIEHFRFVYNSRDLSTGKPRQQDQWAEYRKIAKWLCHASGIRRPEDVKKDADAFIVGEHLPMFVQYYEHDKKT